MRHSNGTPAGGTNFTHVPLGAGGQLIKLSIANDGAKIVCADIHGAYVRYPTDTSWRYLYSGLPAGLIVADHTRAGFPGGTWNDSQGCADAVFAPSDSTNIWLIFEGQLCLSTNSGTSFAATAAVQSKFTSNGNDSKAWSGHFITVDPADSSVVLFGTEGNGVFYSTNKGSTFTSLSVAAGALTPSGYASPHFTGVDPTSTVSGSPSAHQKWYYTRFNPTNVIGSVQNPTVTVGNSFSINGTTVTLTGTTAYQTVVDINNAAITGISAILYNSATQVQIVNNLAGGNIVLANVSGTPLAALGFSAGTTSAANGGVYESTTGPGGTYTQMSNSPNGVTSFFIDAAGTKWATQYGLVENIYKCPAGGSWSKLNTATGKQFGCIAVDPNTTSVVVAQTGLGTYYRSRDTGATWPDLWTNDLTNNPPQQILREPGIKYIDIPSQQYNIVTNMMAFDPTHAGRLWSAGWIDIVYADLPATGGGSANRLNWYGTGIGIEEAVCHTVCVTSTGLVRAGCWDLGTYRVDDPTRAVNPQICGYNAGDTFANGLKYPTLVQPCASIDYGYDNPNWIAFLNWGGWNSFGSGSPEQNPHVSFSNDGGQTIQVFPVAPPNCPIGNGGGSMAVGAAGNVVILWNVNKLGVYTQDGGNTWHNISISGMIDGDNGIDVTGNGGYFLNCVNITHDKLGYFYLFSEGNGQTPNPVGVWRSPDGATWTKMLAGAPAALSGHFGYQVSQHLRAVPGQSNELFFTNGDGGSSFTGILIRSHDGGATWSSSGLTVNSGQAITNVTDIGFGMAPPGRTYPAIYFWGQVAGTVGLYRSDDNLVTAVLQSSFPAGSIAQPMQVVGDMSQYGVCYLAMNGHGLVKGTYSFNLTAS